MLTARDISVSFGRRRVIDGVSVELHPGEIIVLLGPNGAGKSTLLRSLNSTVPIDQGEILMDGTPIGSMSRREIARKIAVVAQENETKFPITVIDFVLSARFAGGSAFGWESKDDIASAKNALRLCDLGEFGDRLMNELSGGERQRVVLARALAAETKVLLLDEPTANLDLAHQSLMFRLVRDRCQTGGAGAIVITHDLNLAAAFADRVLLLKEGKLIATGAPADVLTATNLREIYDVHVLLDENPASGKVRVTTVFDR
jgi:iron complex transport system ATP-binding protein